MLVSTEIEISCCIIEVFKTTFLFSKVLNSQEGEGDPRNAIDGSYGWGIDVGDEFLPPQDDTGAMLFRLN